jgi:AraC-like DNA-binding protein
MAAAAALAKSLRISATRPVSQVGYQLGFNNPSHFSRVFKQSFGAAPTTVAKQGN